MSEERIFYYARANQMVGHDFTDDVAICKASSKSEALCILKRLYGWADEDTVHEVKWGDDKVCILTDY